LNYLIEEERKKRESGYEARVKGYLEVIHEMELEENFTKGNAEESIFSKVLHSKNTGGSIGDKLRNFFQMKWSMRYILINISKYKKSVKLIYFMTDQYKTNKIFNSLYPRTVKFP